ncbi:unnamed protein product, partial [Polarella glacialis]
MAKTVLKRPSAAASSVMKRPAAASKAAPKRAGAASAARKTKTTTKQTSKNTNAKTQKQTTKQTNKNTKAATTKASNKQTLKKRPAAAGRGPAAELNVRKSLDEIQDDLNAKGWGIILLEPACTRSTLAALIKKDHLLLPVEVVGPACEVSGDMDEMRLSWAGGGTSLGNALWQHYIFPGTADAERMIHRGHFRAAFTELLGLLLFMESDDCWLCDQEVACDR